MNEMPRRVAVLGLGYVGLQLVQACIRAGHEVVGFDTDPAKIASLQKGISPVDDVSDSDIAEWLTRGFSPTEEPAELISIDVFAICVPTPLTSAGRPDLTAVESATATIEQHLTSKQTNRTNPLVVLESTTYPGTTEEVVKPILEKNGLQAGIDFHLAFSPERIDPGNKTWTFANTPKVVGGLTIGCADVAVNFYQPLTVQVVRTKGLKEAEMAKLLENTYRHVNIALVNELWKLSHQLGIDIWDVIDAAATKPYGFQAFKPGPGVGGHCIPIDPNYLSHRVKSELGEPFRFVELAQEINAAMPAYVMHRAEEKLREQGKSLRAAKILILGVTYKPDIADIRETPAVPLINSLIQGGARVSFHDPYVREIETRSGTLKACDDALSSINQADLTILVQDHQAYAELRTVMAPDGFLDTRAGNRIPGDNE